MFRDKRYQEVTGVILILCAILVFLSLVSYSPGDHELLSQGSPTKNMIGPLGAFISFGLRSAFGIAAFILSGICAISGMSFIRHGQLSDVLEKIFSLIYISFVFSGLVTIMSDAAPQFSGGFIGKYQYQVLHDLAGPLGAVLIISILNFIGLILLGIVSLSALLDMAGNQQPLSKVKNMFKTRSGKKAPDGELPLTSIGDEQPSGTTDKIPWIKKSRISKKIKLPLITKQTFIVTRDKHEQDAQSIKYLEMQVPQAANETFYQFEDITRDHLSAKEKLKDFDFDSDQEIIPAREIDADIEDDSYTVTSYKDLKETITDNEPLNEEIDDDQDLDDIYFDTPFDEPKQKAESYDIKQNRFMAIDSADGSTEDPEMTDNNIQTPSSINKADAEEDLARSEKLVFSEIKLKKKYSVPKTFLQNAQPVDSESWMTEVKKNSTLLVNTLADFGIESKVVNVNRGPVITLYEVQIAPGIKVNRIVGLADDIAMALAAYRVRIVAPIPGKSAIGVEIPNKLREKVTLGDIINSDYYRKKEAYLKVGLGKDILGKPVTLDLKKLPHLLIAGATGAGKSVCVNAIINSLIYNYDPNYVRFILVDPKMVELQLYNGLPHLLTPVITEPFVAPVVLKWAVYEMERRYRLLSEMNCRDVERYNEKIKETLFNHEHLPYIVIIIDELADLMMVASKEIEGYITRIAQKARAVGIHLVLATQRPSVDIITGIIKANFPARIAFQVAQKTDSRTIIDQNGAEKLLGKGDMLYQSPNGSYPVRIQGAFISEDEITSIVDHLGEMGEPHYIDIEESIFDAESQIDDDDQADELFVEALKIVEETRKASASYLQRRLSIGYNRAARIIEMMEDRGYVGPQQGSKPREVLI